MPVFQFIIGKWVTGEKKKAEKILELIELILKKCDRHFPNDHVDSVLELVHTHASDP